MFSYINFSEKVGILFSLFQFLGLIEIPVEYCKYFLIKVFLVLNLHYFSVK